MPRVCPAINASRANPREQITGGEAGEERERGGADREGEDGGEEANGNSSDRVAART